jgi:alpha-galactosidase
VAVGGEDTAVVAGLLETGRQFGLVHVRRVRGRAGTRLEIELEWVIERALEPGERLDLEEAWVALGSDVNRLLEAFASVWGRAAGARTAAPFQTGWCSWYHFFHDITEEALLRNLDALASRRDELPVALVQLDDGYQRAIGDWLETNEKFPSGLAFVADRIRDAGFDAGIWTAPFSAVRHSHLLESHPDWALRGDDGEWLRGTLIPQWSAEGWCYALDPSHSGFEAHVEHVHRCLAEMGFSYQKLDFVYMASMRGTAADPNLGRAERLRVGLDAVRRGAGDDAFLLGCGCPMGPAVGRVDGMRIGPDVAPTWAVDAPNVIPGIEPALPATGSAIRSIATRLFMHRRLWLNDPDCLMVRRRETRLSPDEIGCLADAIGASGGMVVFSDDVDLLGDDDAALLRSTVATGRAVDAAAPQGVARLADGFVEGSSSDRPGASCRSVATIEAPVGTLRLRADLNLGEEPAELDDGVLAPHASRARVSSVPRPVAVFCDFDGTFIDRDVGSGLARKHLAARRDALWGRFEAGELDAWTYVVELFTGFDLPEPERLDFLDAIELDPGAPALIELCRSRGWHFEVLSDGFDLNIAYLRERFGIDFQFRSNRLEIGASGWRLSPGGRPRGCACGTGLCKRRVIEAFRASQPDALVVHVGNGRVSDLCAALQADWAFAKDTLGPALDDVGCAHLPFDHLGDVVDALEQWLASRSGALERAAEDRTRLRHG